MPLKANAWLDLTEGHAKGGHVDRFLNGIVADPSIDPKPVKLSNGVAGIVERIFALSYATLHAPNADLWRSLRGVAGSLRAEG